MKTTKTNFTKNKMQVNKQTHLYTHIRTHTRQFRANLYLLFKYACYRRAPETVHSDTQCTDT